MGPDLPGPGDRVSYTEPGSMVTGPWVVVGRSPEMYREGWVLWRAGPRVDGSVDEFVVARLGEMRRWPDKATIVIEADPDDLVDFIEKHRAFDRRVLPPLANEYGSGRVLAAMCAAIRDAINISD